MTRILLVLASTLGVALCKPQFSWYGQPLTYGYAAQPTYTQFAIDTGHTSVNVPLAAGPQRLCMPGDKCPPGLTCQNGVCVPNEGSTCDPTSLNACKVNEICQYQEEGTYECVKDPNECGENRPCKSGLHCLPKQGIVCEPNTICNVPLVCIEDPNECGPYKGVCASGKICTTALTNCPGAACQSVYKCVDDEMKLKEGGLLDECNEHKACNAGKKCMRGAMDPERCQQNQMDLDACTMVNKCVEDNDECNPRKPCERGKRCKPDFVECAKARKDDPNAVCIPDMKCVGDKNQCTTHGIGYPKCPKGQKCGYVPEPCFAPNTFCGGYNKCMEDRDECKIGDLSRNCKPGYRCVQDPSDCVNDELDNCIDAPMKCIKDMNACYPNNPNKGCPASEKCVFRPADGCEDSNTPECAPYYQCVENDDECYLNSHSGCDRGSMCVTAFKPCKYQVCAFKNVCKPLNTQCQQPQVSHTSLFGHVLPPLNGCLSGEVCQLVQIPRDDGFYYRETACVDPTPVDDCESNGCENGRVCVRLDKVCVEGPLVECKYQHYCIRKPE